MCTVARGSLYGQKFQLPDPGRRVFKPQEDHLGIIMFQQNAVFHRNLCTVKVNTQSSFCPCLREMGRVRSPDGDTTDTVTTSGSPRPQLRGKSASSLACPDLRSHRFLILLETVGKMVSLRRLISGAHHYGAVCQIRITVQDSGQHEEPLWPPNSFPSQDTAPAASLFPVPGGSDTQAPAEYHFPDNRPPPAGSHKNLIKYFLAGFSFTMAIEASGAAPINRFSGSALPAATLQENCRVRPDRSPALPRDPYTGFLRRQFPSPPASG